jgi:hypothetical protein
VRGHLYTTHQSLIVRWPAQRETLRVSQALTSGGSYGSLFLSMLNNATNSFRAVATIATLCGLFRLFRNRQ